MERFEELLDGFEQAVVDALRTGMARPVNIARVDAARSALVEYVDGLRRQRDELHEKNKEAVVALVAHSENETRLLSASIQACEERDEARRIAVDGALCDEGACRMAGCNCYTGLNPVPTNDDRVKMAKSLGWSYIYETPEGGEG